jgi:RND family efflux transporter MFP subunit
MPDICKFGNAFLLALLVSGSALASEPEHFCQVVASERVDLVSSVPGVIEKILADRGDRVEAGQPVAQLRADVERAQFEIVKLRAANKTVLRARDAKLAFANRKFERNSQLAATHVVSANEFDSIRTDRDIAQQEYDAAVEAQKEAEAELYRAEVDLGLRTIRSPFPGIITERRLSPGALLRDQPIMVIQRTDPLHVELTLPVSIMGQVGVGTPVTISFATPSVEPVKAKISMTDSVIDAASDTFGARIVLENASGAVPAGSKCRIKFLNAQQ